MTARTELDRLIERNADDTADATLLVGLALIEKACADARAAIDFRWRSYPRGEVRHLRRGVREGLRMCTAAMLISEADRERFEADRSLADEACTQACASSSATAKR